MQIHLDPTPRSVPLARRWLLDMLAPESPYDVEVARLLVSELVTNAVLHARTSFTVEVSEERSTLRVSVCDSADALDRGTPRTALGSDDRDESTVWFELTAEPGTKSASGDQLSA